MIRAACLEGKCRRTWITLKCIQIIKCLRQISPSKAPAFLTAQSIPCRRRAHRFSKTVFARHNPYETALTKQKENVVRPLLQLSNLPFAIEIWHRLKALAQVAQPAQRTRKTLQNHALLLERMLRNVNDADNSQSDYGSVFRTIWTVTPGSLASSLVDGLYDALMSFIYAIFVQFLRCFRINLAKADHGDHLPNSFTSIHF